MSSPEPSKYDANFVSQDQIDTLLKGSGEYLFPDGEDPLGDIADFINIDEIDRLLGGDDLGDDELTGVYREDQMSDEPFPEEEGFDDEDLSMISMDDIQRVLSEDQAEKPEEDPLDDLNIEEIVDASRGESAQGDDGLISQDDIDRLLKSSGLDGDEVYDKIDEGFQFSPGEMETLLTDTSEDAPKAENEELVEETPRELADEELPLEVPRSKKKRLVMALSLLLLFTLGGGAGWFFFMNDGGKASPAAALSTSTSGMRDEVGAGPASLDAVELQVISRLENFIIPAAEGNDYAFVSMHVVITIRGVKSDPLKGYESFYRKRIYDDMVANLATLSKEKPVKNQLRELVRKTAGALLAEGVIHEVVLENYRLM